MPKVSYYRNKADRLLQEIGRKKFKKCIVCGKPMSCLHHFFPKSKATALRYDFDNTFPLCAGCHLAHHTGDPTIHAYIMDGMGVDWYKRLCSKRDKSVKAHSFYKENYEALSVVIKQL